MIRPSVWYLAHPVGPPCACPKRAHAAWTAYAEAGDAARAEIMVACNLARAKRWLSWCWEMAPNVSIMAPWMPYVELLHDSNPAHRERGLRDNCAAASRCDGIILAGGRVSIGMELERSALLGASRILYSDYHTLDLTPLGDEPPNPCPDEFAKRLRGL